MNATENTPITEQRTTPFGFVYWIAFLPSHPDNYSLGGTREQALEYLLRAIQSRPDIYGAFATHDFPSTVTPTTPPEPTDDDSLTDDLPDLPELFARVDRIFSRVDIYG